MRYFLDTEFIEDGKTIDLISIGILADDGRTFYAINSECDYSRANQWVKDNVLCHLPGVGGTTMTRAEIKAKIVEFIGSDKPEFWGYYADYDWVVFCWLFGTMMDLPKGWPMYCRDIKQFCDSLGNPKLPDQADNEHHALADAKWNKMAYEWLMQYGMAIEQD